VNMQCTVPVDARACAQACWRACRVRVHAFIGMHKHLLDTQT
jgi:hypothetical protein